MPSRVLAVAAGPGCAAASLAQRFARDVRGVADVVSLSGETLPSGTWERAWSFPGAGAADVRDLVRDVLADGDYDAVVFDEQGPGREAAGRLAARAGLAVIAQVVSLKAMDGALQAVRVSDAGARTAILAVTALPALVVASGTIAEAAGPPGTAREWMTPRSTPIGHFLDVLGETRLTPGEMDVTEAEVVVAGGRGVGPAGFALLEELAAELGGTVGASRVAVDAGWAPYARQVGLTGKTVTPRLYIACGISGAPHHTLGMRSSGLIVAINTDAQAPIFKLAHVSLVADVTEVVPALLRDLRARRAGTTPVLAGVVP